MYPLAFFLCGSVRGKGPQLGSFAGLQVRGDFAGQRAGPGSAASGTLSGKIANLGGFAGPQQGTCE